MKSLYWLEIIGKGAQIVQGIATPIIAFWIGRITSRIQQQQVRTQTQQAETQHLQYRFVLMERRMRVFDATMEFIVFVLQKANMEELEPLFKFNRDTREHHLLFGSEIGAFIDQLYKEGARLGSARDRGCGIENRDFDAQRRKASIQWKCLGSPSESTDKTNWKETSQTDRGAERLDSIALGITAGKQFFIRRMFSAWLPSLALTTTVAY